MSITNEVIARFFDRRCTEEEAVAVVEHLKQYPELIDTYLPKAEWDATAMSIPDLPYDLSTRMWTEIKKSTQRPVVITMRRMVIAASFIGVLLLSYFLIKGLSTERKGAQKSNVVAVQKSPSIAPVLVINGEGKAKTVQLPDGSTVTLEAHSQISYEMEPATRLRTIRLEGEALFKVARDSLRPFTVYSGDVATTALGTAFYVSGKKGSDHIDVLLYEGKVVVKTQWSRPSAIKNYYLLPGNKLRYDAKSLMTRIIDFKNDRQLIVSKEKNADNRFMFNNDSLSETLDQLAAIYGVQIIYSREDLKGISFIGEIRKSDAIDNILKDIAYLNKLTVTRKGKRYTIQRKK